MAFQEPNVRPSPSSGQNALSAFLTNSKVEYLAAVEQGTTSEWTVVMGNEAGGALILLHDTISLGSIPRSDLDTMASSFAYAWFNAAVNGSARTVALSQTPRSDLHLRPENLYALSLAGIDVSGRDILCIDDIPVPPSSPFPSTKFVLLDHNRLLERFTRNNPEASVVAVIDHHDDEGLYKDTANPRIIAVPTGSCASLVTLLFKQTCPDKIPPEIATLLLCAILIDTGGLKPGGKAESVDHEATAYLAPRSGSEGFVSELAVNGLTEILQTKKSSVSDLGTRDLLRRDYKEYSWTPHWAPSTTILVGLATVPRGFKSWVPEDKEFWNEADGWMDERGLAVLGILTSFHEAKKHKTEEHKHKREMLFVVRESEENDELSRRLWQGLEESEDLRLEKKDFAEYELGEANTSRKVRVYKQGNVHATRKVTAPLVKRIVEGSRG